MQGQRGKTVNSGPKPKYAPKLLFKIFDLLETFDKGGELGISELSIKTGLSVSTVHRLLSGLEYRGYIRQNTLNAKYTLGTKILQLANNVDESELIALAEPYMRRLATELRETINLGVLENTEVVYLEKKDVPNLLRADLRVGTKVPAHCTALGKAILAFLQEEQYRFLKTRRLQQVTEKTVTTWEQLDQQLQSIRRQGYAVDDEEFGIGIRCIATPILDEKGNALAAISVSGPAVRMTEEALAQAASLLLECTKSISRSL